MNSGRDRGVHRGIARWRLMPAGRRTDQGSATAELAVAFPVVVLLMLVGFTGISALAAKVRCVDAAGVAARAAARGEPGESAGQRAAPEGATISVRVEGDNVRVTVRTRMRTLPLLPSITVEGQAVAVVEPNGDAP